MKLQHFSLNTNGRDFVVGDIHGCFSLLTLAMDAVGFDPSKDRLFSVGDLVDRGPESADVLDWLAKPWFHAVRGNHEQMAINFQADLNHAFHYEMNGGRWFIDLPSRRQKMIAECFEDLPIAIQVDTKIGRVGIIHAEVPHNDWYSLINISKQERDIALWARDKVQSSNETPIRNIDRVYVGHTPLKAPIVLGNVHYIDTGAVFGNKLTLEEI